MLQIEKEILKGHIDTIILSLLQTKDMYGYELAKRAHEKSRNEFELKEGTMYLALKRMEKSGFIESYWGDEENKGGRRKYYRILPEGIEKLLQKKQEWVVVNNILKSFLGEGE